MTVSAQAVRALVPAAATALVRGFIARRSIFAAITDVAEGFRALVAAWSAARDPRLDGAERSGQ